MNSRAYDIWKRSERNRGINKNKIKQINPGDVDIKMGNIWYYQTLTED